MMGRRGRDSRGSVLVIVLLVFAGLLILGGALAAVSYTEMLIAHNQEQDLKLCYITEAGVEAGIAAVQSSAQCSGPIEGEIGGGSYKVQVEELALEPGHPCYEQLQRWQPGSPGERLVISTGALKGQEMVQAAIVEPSPFTGRALVAAGGAKLERSTVTGGLYSGAPLVIGGENFIHGFLNCAAPGEALWADPESAALTVTSGGASSSPGDGAYNTAVVYSESNPIPDELAAPAPALPQLNLAPLFQEPLIYRSSQRWVHPPDRDSACSPAIIEGDLLIEPAPGSNFILENQVILVKGDLAIRVDPEAAADFPGALFVVQGAVTIAGKINGGPRGADSRVLFISEGEIAVGAGGWTGKELTCGGALLLSSKSGVEVGNGAAEVEFNIKGVIIAKEVALYRSKLCYEPEIYALAKELLDMEVVVKEWITPWKR